MPNLTLKLDCELSERGRISSKKRMSIFNRDGNKCLRCGTKENLTIDHIVPLVLGGRNRVENFQTLCKGCNEDKGREVIDYRVGPIWEISVAQAVARGYP